MARRISALAEKSSQALEDNDTLITICQDIAMEIESGRSKIHSVVEELGPYLTNSDVAVRENGVKTLSMVLSKLPKDLLDLSEVRLLTAFYCDRTKDHHSIGPATVLGILAIAQMKHLPDDAPSRLIHSIFENVPCQSLLQDVRRNIYLIIQTLCLNHTDVLKSMGPDFVYGVITAMDGECEPRNLMLLFNFLPKFIKTFPLGHLSEEMFEVIACYFPIDFNTCSETGEKKKITRDDLAVALEPCLFATPKFATYSVPLAMEKLDSDHKTAKLDSLSLLANGASTFGPEGLKSHVNDLWPLLRKEMMSGGDQEVKNAALSTISAIVKAIANDEETRKSYVEKIFADTRWSLCDVQLSMYWPAEKLLEAVAKTEINSCKQVLREIIPLCLGQYSTKTSLNDKVTLMETLNNFIRISEDFGFMIGDIPELAWTDIPGLYLNELATCDNTLKAKTLSGLIIQKSSLKEGQRSVVYKNVCELIESDIVGEVRNMGHSTLFAFAKLYPNEMLEVLTKSLQIDVDNADAVLLTRRLEAVSILARIPEIGVAVLPQILKIAILSDFNVDTIALSCMLRLLGTPNNDFDIHNYLYKECNTIDRLMSCDTENPKKLLLVSSVCRSIVRKLIAEDQQTVVDKYVVIRDGKLSESQILLFEGLLTALRQNVEIKDVECLLLDVFKLAIDSVKPEVARSSCKIIAVLINKMKEDTIFGSILNNLRERIIDILESDEPDIRRKKAAISLHAWLTKSLVTKGSSISQDFLDYQLNILRIETIGAYMPEEFKTLVDKSENTLTEENFCTIKIFYKQRIFQNVIESNSGFDGKSRQNYLVALAHLVEEVPIELPIMHLEGLVPLLVESLSLDEGQLLMSSLKTLKVLLETKHDIFLDQIQCFIPRCLQLSTYNKMNVRIAALDCLLSYCKYPVVEILKYKQDILEKLGEAVDDDKRLVRRIAVKARTRWYLVGAPGTPD